MGNLVSSSILLCIIGAIALAIWVMNTISNFIGSLIFRSKLIRENPNKNSYFITTKPISFHKSSLLRRQITIPKGTIVICDILTPFFSELRTLDYNAVALHLTLSKWDLDRLYRKATPLEILAGSSLSLGIGMIRKLLFRLTLIRLWTGTTNDCIILRHESEI